ncbi:MAG: DNA-binding response regulator [Chitinophagaceae bacterium BSSC1]|nr:MAG: DNA-binding response regulator [Chitinophagaceae bacterium BSSC1]
MVSKSIKIAIVDDHQIVIDGIVALLNGHKELEVVAMDTSAQNMLLRMANMKVDLLLTDIMMPEMNGHELATIVRKKYPETKILALSMSGQGELVDGMINQADINGYVLKNISKQELLNAIQKIANGGIYFSEEVLNELAAFSQMRKEEEKVQLTVREKEIIQLMEKEYSNKQIADELFISERTVETHRKNIFRKTNTNSVLGLIKYAYQHKIIQGVN